MAAEQKDNDFILSQLSGATSFSFLLPPQPSLPLILLLGDVHQSEENRCSPCSPSSSCYPIESLDFLEALDQLAEEYPIDFYTESDPRLQHPNYYTNVRGIDRTNKNSKNVLFRKFLQNTVKHCHDTSSRVRSNYIDRCPTSYIRWHYSDIRTFPNTIEGYLFAPLRYLLEINKAHYLEHNHHTEYYLESISYLRSKQPILFHTIKDSRLYQAGHPFTLQWLQSMSEFRKSDSLTDSFLIALSHVFHVFHTSNTFLKKTMKGAIPDTPISRHIQSHLYEHFPLLSPYKESIYHLVWNLFLSTSPFKPSNFKEKRELEEFVTQIMTVITSVTTFIHRSYEMYFQFVEHSYNEWKTGLWKQYKKQSLPALKDPSIWITLFCKDNLLFPYYLSPFVSLYFYQTLFATEDFYSVIRELLRWNKKSLLPSPFPSVTPLRPHLPSLRSIESHGKDLLLSLMSSLFHAIVFLEKNMLDLYLIWRMFKIPSKGSYEEEGVQSSLSLVFLGNEHCRHLQQLLLSPLLGYQVKIGIELPPFENQDKVNRCITLPEPLSLRHELEKHIHTMNEWKSNRRNRYQRRVLEENSKRGKKRIYQTRKKKNQIPLRPYLPPPTNNNNNSLYGST